MNFRGMIAACMAGGSASVHRLRGRQSKNGVPDTDTAVFIEMEQTGLEGWDDAENETVQDVPLVRRDVELASGGTAALYALDTGEEPSTGTDELTSVSAELAPNSAADRSRAHTVRRAQLARKRAEPPGQSAA